jgi:hypothetical protein
VALIRVGQLGAKLRQLGKLYGLARMLDFSCVKQVVEDRSETAQLPESGVVEFHYGLPVADTAHGRTEPNHGFFP